jgi:hypothetical protein
MKSYFLLFPMILVTSAAIGAPPRMSSPPSELADAQALAAALLSRPHTFGTRKANGATHLPSHALAPPDAQARAAALLSRPSPQTTANSDVPVGRMSRASTSADAQAQAAALFTR